MLFTFQETHPTPILIPGVLDRVRVLVSIFLPAQLLGVPLGRRRLRADVRHLQVHRRTSRVGGLVRQEGTREDPYYGGVPQEDGRKEEKEYLKVQFFEMNITLMPEPEPWLFIAQSRAIYFSEPLMHGLKSALPRLASSSRQYSLSLVSPSRH